MRKFFLFFFFILTLTSAAPMLSYNYVEPVYGKMADRILAKTAKILTKRHNMYVIGTGGGFIGHVNMLALSFQIWKTIDQNETRMLIVDCIEEFLCQINSDEEIRQYLKHYPFTSADIEIEIYSHNEKGGPVYDPAISVVSNYVDKKSDRSYLWYCTKSPDQPYGYKSEIEEDYEEALRIVNEQKKQQQQTPAASGEKIPSQ